MMSCRSAVALQHRLHLAGNAGVFLTDDVGAERAGCRCQRIHRGVNALAGDAAFEIDECVQVLERVGRRGIGWIVSRNVNGLHRRDSAGFWCW